MSAAAEQSLPVRMRVRSNNSRASVDAMGVRSVRNAAVVVRKRNDRRNSSALRSSSPRLRKPRGSGRESVADVVAAEVAARNPLRIRTLPLRSSNSNRVRRANRVLLGRRKRRVRILPRVQRRVRKVMDRNGAGVFGVAGAVVGADRKALRRRRSHAERRGRGEKTD
ncbi:MAG TPA: hypothetical protein VGQ65_22980 [Thermoanaerobaculia bacterium]|jgi:hypothetical protein|nr:hypothetical protein [Thermoanaerobaculia bacterium]